MRLDKVMDFYHESKLSTPGESAAWEIGDGIIGEVRNMTDDCGTYGCQRETKIDGETKETLLGIPVKIITGAEFLSIRFKYPDGRERIIEASLHSMRLPRF